MPLLRFSPPIATAPRLLAGAAALVGALVASTPAHAQSAAVDPATSPADDPRSASGEGSAYRFDGRGVWVGAGPGVIPEEGDAGFASRVQVVFPVATDWFAIEGGLLGQSFSVRDHHGEPIDGNVAAITTGARFSLPPDAPLRPHAAVRLAHLHFFPDPYRDHGHDDEGSADHGSHHRWGAGAAIGFDVGIPEPASRFRVGLEGEALALTGPGVSVIGQVIALFGVGF